MLRWPGDKLAAWCLSVWLTIGGLVGLLLGQYQMGVLHPVVIPFLFLLLTTLIAVVATVISVVQRLIRGERRRAAILWFMVVAIPLSLFVNSFVYAQKQWSKRRVPNGIRGKIAIVAGGGLMEAEAAYRYPNRIESEHLVMFYWGLTDAEAELAEMNRHVMALERKLGRSLRSKTHWGRGPRQESDCWNY